MFTNSTIYKNTHKNGVYEKFFIEPIINRGIYIQKKTNDRIFREPPSFVQTLDVVHLKYVPCHQLVITQGRPPLGRSLTSGPFTLTG